MQRMSLPVGPLKMVPCARLMCVFVSSAPALGPGAVALHHRRSELRGFERDAHGVGGSMREVSGVATWFRLWGNCGTFLESGAHDGGGRHVVPKIVVSPPGRRPPFNNKPKNKLGSVGAKA